MISLINAKDVNQTSLKTVRKNNSLFLERMTSLLSEGLIIGNQKSVIKNFFFKVCKLSKKRGRINSLLLAKLSKLKFAKIKKQPKRGPKRCFVHHPIF